MAQNKTQPTDVVVEQFIDNVGHAGKRADALVLDQLFRRVTGHQPVMWGPSIIGYGSYHYEYASGRAGDMCRTGFSPRKARHSIYLMGGYCDPVTSTRNEQLLRLVGKHSRGKSCLYINKLADIDLDVLERLVQVNWDAMNRIYPV